MSSQRDAPGPCDLAIIGAGPVGLAAAVHAAAIGLDTVVLARGTVGGSAHLHARIETPAGFSVGLTGTELVERALAQAHRLGARIMAAAEAVAVQRTERGALVQTTTSGHVLARAVLLATGVARRLPPIPGVADFIGAGVHMYVPPEVPAAMVNRDVFVVGDPMRAADAAVALSEHCRSVTIVTGERRLAVDLDGTLRSALRARPNIAVRRNTAIVQIAGVARLESLILHDARTGRLAARNAAGLFIVQRTQPRTAWLPDSVLRNDTGHVITGRAAAEHACSPWPLARRPSPCESSMPGLFAAGEIRQYGARGPGALAEAIMVAGAVEDQLREAQRIVRLSARACA